MRIEPNTPSRLRGPDAPEHIRSGGSAVRGSQYVQAETVELSQLNILLGYLANLTEDREDLIGTIQQHLAEGYYDSVDATQKVAQLLVQNQEWLAGLRFDSTSPLTD